MTHQPLSKWKIFWFAFGNFGWCIATFSYAILITYFYFPPVIEGAVEIPEFVGRSPVLFGFTIVGLVYAFNRVLDAISDPIIAGLSDRSTSRFGRRRFYMMLSFIPTGLASAAIFFPPVHETSGLNIAWLIGCCIVVTISVTMYCVPYMSLIAELGKTDHDRVLISTFCSVSWALAFAVGQTVWVLKDTFQGMGFSAVEAVQISVSIFSLLGIITMLVPILAIDEKRDCIARSSSEGTFEALVKAFQNKNFAIFTVSNGLAFMSRFFLEVGAIYFITMLMGLPEATATTMMLALFGASFLFYPLVVKLSTIYTKKRLFQFALAAEGVLLMAYSLSRYVPNPEMYGWCILLLLPLPLAIMGIIPNVIVADLALSDAAKTGNHKEAVFFGANMFAYKAATSLTALVFPSIIIIGAAKEAGVETAPTILGVTLSSVVAGVLAFIGVAIMSRYNEKQVMDDIGEYQAEPAHTPELEAAQPANV